MRARMLAQDSAARVHDFALTLGGIYALLPEIRIDERCVIAVRDKANLLAIVLGGDRQPQFARKLADFRFNQPSQRKGCA